MSKLFELDLEIIGRVQGVGFRATIKNYADKNSLKGFVFNTLDGNVRAVIQGTRVQLDKFLEWIRTNPGISRVDNIKFEIGNVKNKLECFEIRTEYGFLEDKSRSFIKLGKSIFK